MGKNCRFHKDEHQVSFEKQCENFLYFKSINYNLKLNNVVRIFLVFDFIPFVQVDQLAMSILIC